MPPTVLLSRLMAAATFEEAAKLALEAMFSTAEETRQESPFAARSALLRGVVYLNPGDGYRRFFGLEHRSGASLEGLGYLASANVWRWMVEHRCAVSVDVRLGSFRPWVDGSALRPMSAERDPAGVPGPESRERLLSRDATHVHAVPLLLPGGGVGGMIILEANCKAATGQDFIWGECNEELLQLASLAAPYLSALAPRPKQELRGDEFLPVIGPSTTSLFSLLRVFAQQEETLLISGPTGAGKSRIARWGHEQSRRKGQAFEVLDLLSVPEELQMAELFGWKRGAFTGAVKDSQGAVARAQGGTLFLDEIDKLSLKAQAGLLHVLEERRYRPLGDDANERRADLRFLVGTNADLRASVAAGRFREDLYYRISVLPVRLPSLRERLDELPLWAEYMLTRRHGGPGATLTPRALERLVEAPWPGNLRQLDNVIRRAYALALPERAPTGTITLDARHVEQALAYEGAPESGSLFAQLWRAAAAWVSEAEKRQNLALSLDQTESFRGFVLGAALQKLGNRDQAFSLLGQTQAVRHRNHHKILRREFDKVRALARALGEVGSPVTAFDELEHAPDSLGGKGTDERGNR